MAKKAAKKTAKSTKRTTKKTAKRKAAPQPSGTVGAGSPPVGGTTESPAPAPGTVLSTSGSRFPNPGGGTDGFSTTTVQSRRP